MGLIAVIATIAVIVIATIAVIAMIGIIVIAQFVHNRNIRKVVYIYNTLHRDMPFFTNLRKLRNRSAFFTVGIYVEIFVDGLRYENTGYVSQDIACENQKVPLGKNNGISQAMATVGVDAFYESGNILDIRRMLPLLVVRTRT